MRNQEKIFVIGHKNPDTDSICSAIAYADIKNRTSQKVKYIPKRAGQINEETEYVLNRFGMQPPGYLSNIGTQIKDMDIRMSPEADKSMSLKNAWDLMMEKSIVSLPIRDREGQLEGLITIGDIAKTYMDTTDSYLLSRAKTQYRRIAETIAGTVVEGNEHGYFTKGKVLVGTANPEMLKAYIEPDDLIIMGDREEDHLQAIAQNVSCIIVGMGIEVSEKVIKLAHEREIVIIMSPYDTFTIARLINQSIPVRYIMKTDNLVTFNTEDFTDDIQNEMIKHRHRAFPVINKKGKCIGTISRRNFLDMHRKKVALVDHNEKDQAVDNIDKAEIVEIIDHHKLGSLETMVPISFRNQPVGCTATILYEMYGEQKLEISPSIAGLLCAAIISDTLMFRSPTCTLSDKMAAGALALIAGINIAGDRYFYVNPLEVVPEFCTEHTYMEHVKPVRQKWFGVACCPPNVGRTLASLGQYIYAEDEEGVYINQFISSTADTEIKESRMKIKMDSTLLQDGKVQLQVQSSGPGILNIRIPWYSEKWECVQNGISIKTQPDKGYQRLCISPGDTRISIDFHVVPRWMGANDQVRADAGKTALMKGPLVYCLEEKENGRFLSEIFVEENTSIEENAPAEELVGNVPTLSYKGIRVRNKGADGENQLYGSVELEKEEVSLRAVPYCMWNNRGQGEMLVWHKLRI